MSNWYKTTVVALGWMMIAGGTAAPALGQEDAAADSPAPALPAEAPQRVIISSGLGSAVIAAQRPDAAVWLDLEGDDSGLALFEPEQQLPAQGALLMLADEGQTAASDLLAALGESLSSDGWAVMTLGLESPPFALQQAWKQAEADLPGASANPGVAGETAGEGAASVMIDVMDDGEQEDLETVYLARIDGLLTAASANLRGRGYQRVVLVAVGANAIHAARYAAGGNVDELVWVTPRFHRRDEPGLVELLGGADTLRVLHLYSPRAEALAARERTSELKKTGMNGYQAQPVGVASPADVRDAGALANRIGAWLNAR